MTDETGKTDDKFDLAKITVDVSGAHSHVWDDDTIVAMVKDKFKVGSEWLIYLDPYSTDEGRTFISVQTNRIESNILHLDVDVISTPSMDDPYNLSDMLEAYENEQVMLFGDHFHVCITGGRGPVSGCITVVEDCEKDFH